jgi:hypothetical protein
MLVVRLILTPIISVEDCKINDGTCRCSRVYLYFSVCLSVEYWIFLARRSNRLFKMLYKTIFEVRRHFTVRRLCLRLRAITKLSKHQLHRRYLKLIFTICLPDFLCMTSCCNKEMAALFSDWYTWRFSLSWHDCLAVRMFFLPSVQPALAWVTLSPTYKMVSLRFEIHPL